MYIGVRYLTNACPPPPPGKNPISAPVPKQKKTFFFVEIHRCNRMLCDNRNILKP